MRKTGEKKMFRIRCTPHAYNHRIPLWDGDAQTGWVLESENSFAAFNMDEGGDTNFESVICTRIPMGHMIYDPGREAYRPTQDTIVMDVRDARQFAWAKRGEDGGDMYSGVGDPDTICINDIFLSRSVPQDPSDEKDINVILIMEKVDLTELESVVVSGKNRQLGMDSSLGMFQHP